MRIYGSQYSIPIDKIIDTGRFIYLVNLIYFNHTVLNLTSFANTKLRKIHEYRNE